jgi:hypothetical protein
MKRLIPAELAIALCLALVAPWPAAAEGQPQIPVFTRNIALESCVGTDSAPAWQSVFLLNDGRVCSFGTGNHNANQSNAVRIFDPVSLPGTYLTYDEFPWTQISSAGYSTTSPPNSFSSGTNAYVSNYDNHPSIYLPSVNKAVWAGHGVFNFDSKVWEYGDRVPNTLTYANYTGTYPNLSMYNPAWGWWANAEKGLFFGSNLGYGRTVVMYVLERTGNSTQPWKYTAYTITGLDPSYVGNHRNQGVVIGDYFYIDTRLYSGTYPYKLVGNRLYKIDLRSMTLAATLTPCPFVDAAETFPQVVYDPVREKLIRIGIRLHEYDPAADSWSDITPDGWPGYQYPMGVYHPSLQMVFFRGLPVGSSARDAFRWNSLRFADTTPPEITVPSDLTAEATGPDGAVVNFSTEIGATDLIDGALMPVASPASGSIFPLGVSTVAVTATDTGGNTATRAFTVTVADTTPPVISVPSDITIQATGAAGAVVDFNSSISVSDLVGGAIQIASTPASGSVFPVGETAVTVSAKDGKGNAATGTFKITVVDSSGPSITVPADMTAEATSGAGAVVTFTVSASDSKGTLTPDVSPLSGSTFPLGRTTVNVSATGSNGSTSTRQFTVTVVDTTPPAVHVPADMILEAMGAGGATAVYSAAATDLVDGDVAAAASPVSGALFPLGISTVMVTATDKAGGTATGTFKITVVDTMPPTIAVPADIAVEATSPEGAVVYFAASAVDVVSGIVPVVASPASGSIFPIGQSTVTLSATDGAGRTSFNSFSILVGDTTPPSVVGVSASPNPAYAGQQVVVRATLTDAVSGIAGAEYMLDSGSWSAMVAQDGAFNSGSETTTVALSGLSAGTHVVHVRGIDGAARRSDGVPSASITVLSRIATAVVYQGPMLDYDGNGSTTLVATLSSPASSGCENKALSFLTNGTELGRAITNASGTASLTIALAQGSVSEVVVIFAGDAGSEPSSSDPVYVTVSGGSDAAYGGARYVPGTNADFGFIANRRLDKKTNTYTVSGKFLWTSHLNAKLMSTSLTALDSVTIAGYSKAVRVSGTGVLTTWDPGTGSYTNPVTVSFVFAAADGGTVTVKKVTTDKPDAFAVDIPGRVLPGSTVLSSPVVLSAGSIRVN